MISGAGYDSGIENAPQGPRKRSRSTMPEVQPPTKQAKVQADTIFRKPTCLVCHNMQSDCNGASPCAACASNGCECVYYPCPDGATCTYPGCEHTHESQEVVDGGGWPPTLFKYEHA
jgi:hypothetical protein